MAYTIGEVSRLAKVSVRTRFTETYDKQEPGLAEFISRAIESAAGT